MVKFNLKPTKHESKMRCLSLEIRKANLEIVKRKTLLECLA